MTDRELPKGYTCECGAFNEFTAYVYAHWDEVLCHFCKCGRTNDVRRGKVGDAEAPSTECAHDWNNVDSDGSVWPVADSICRQCGTRKGV